MNELIQLFKNASRIFLCENAESIKLGVSERNLCGNFQSYIEKAFLKYINEGYFVDIEYNRNCNGKVKTIINDKMKVHTITCDLILHSRGHHEINDNILALEMKIKQNSRIVDRENDKERLKTLTKELNDDVWLWEGTNFPVHVCGYCLGVYYEIDRRNSKVFIEYYCKGACILKEESKY